jgi:hypothetical protein
MNKEFVPYQESLELKELGFDEPCFGYYGVENKLHIEVSSNLDSNLTRRNFIAAPTYSQAFRWLLKHHNLYGVIIPTETMNWTFKTMTVVESIVEVPPYKHVDANDYGTPEEAELSCLKKLIEIVKNEKK